MAKLALVLAGGGALGAYEVGAIEALIELGFKFDIVTGTSIGALNGAFVCNGQTKALRGLWENITPNKVMVDGVNLSTREFSDSTKRRYLKELFLWGKRYISGKKPGADISPFKEYVKSAIDVDACYRSNIEFGIVTTRLPTMSLVDVNMKKLPKEKFLSFLHASSACFPVFPVEKIDGVYYVDGFYRDNLPIRLAFNMGADKVIAVDMKMFSLEPQNSFYLPMPNVEYIAPHIKLKGPMDFSQVPIQKHMRLGYLDTMKHYKKYWGFTYAFTPFEVDKHFVSYILEKYKLNAKYILKFLTDGIRDPLREDDYFVRALEMIGERLGIDSYYELHTLESFKKLIREKAIERMRKERSKISTIKERMVNVLSYQKNSVIYSFLSDFASKYLKIDVNELVEKNYVE